MWAAQAPVKDLPSDDLLENLDSVLREGWKDALPAVSADPEVVDVERHLGLGRPPVESRGRHRRRTDPATAVLVNDYVAQCVAARPWVDLACPALGSWEPVRDRVGEDADEMLLCGRLRCSCRSEALVPPSVDELAGPLLELLECIQRWRSPSFT